MSFAAARRCALPFLLVTCLVCGQTADDLNAKIPLLNLASSTMADVIALFGEPQVYRWGNEIFTKDKLPETYIAAYSGGFSVVVSRGLVMELRFAAPGYRFQDRLQVGSTLEEVLEVVGQPKATVTGGPAGNAPDTLYKDIDGEAGRHTYYNTAFSVRFFFARDRVNSIFVLRRADAPQQPPPAASLQRFDDVRVWLGSMLKNIGGLDLSGMADVLPTLTFNLRTAWPPPAKMPRTITPQAILEDGMNPGLGVRDLHRAGITGKGVSVAIIDQPLFGEHPEYAGKIAAYFDTGSETQMSMHGPAVASLLVGTNTGTAPDAALYFAAMPSWQQDAEHFARALDWIREQNRALPAERKIRVVSVSANPSGPGSPFRNGARWDRLSEQAEEEGLLILDCSERRGYVNSAWLSGTDRENPAHWEAWYPGMTPVKLTGFLLAPTSPRTTAEEQYRGEAGYQYTGRGGRSWSVPYAAGVLALGWQVRPELSGMEMLQLLFWSAYMKDADTRIIDPKEFIRLVREYRPE